MTCEHINIRELSTTCYTGSVSRDENPAAHGNVCVHEECQGCGARRSRNVNGMHEEVGTWGPTRAARDADAREAEAVVRALIESRPASLTLRRGEDSARVSIDSEGYLSVSASGPMPSDEAVVHACPALVDYARELRLASIRAAQLRADV